MEKLTHFKIGQIVNTQGLKGEVRVYPFTDDMMTQKNSTQEKIQKLSGKLKELDIKAIWL